MAWILWIDIIYKYFKHTEFLLGPSWQHVGAIILKCPKHTKKGHISVKAWTHLDLEGVGDSLFNKDMSNPKQTQAMQWLDRVH